LLEPAGRRQAGRTCANDDDVEFHVFAFHRLSPTHGSSGFSNWARSVARGHVVFAECDGTRSMPRVAHYIYTRDAVQYKRLFELFAG
jgi:hypothetical protein